MSALGQKQTLDWLGEIILDEADQGELEGYDDLHASAAMRRDLFRNLAPLTVKEAIRCAA